MFLVPFIVMYNNRIRSILCMAKLSPHSVKGLRIQDGYGQNCFKAANWFALSQVSQRVKHWNHCIQHLSILIVNTQSLIEDINALEAIKFVFACRVCTSQIPRPKPGNEAIGHYRFSETCLKHFHSGFQITLFFLFFPDFLHKFTISLQSNFISWADN